MYMAAAAMPPPPPPPPPSFPPPSMQPMARYCALPFPPSATALTTSLSTPQSPITMASLSQHDLAESLHRMSLGNGNASAMTATSGNGTGARSTTDLKSEGNEQVTDKVKGHEKRDSVQRSGSDSMALPTSMGILGVIGRGARGGDL
ncbi:hypothetical protein IWX90DRAFT_415697 [Phyllosticta citrichinensis]|uniref:Uncharacterized protein n=1 Tax=Phyllosticta citrichinensis TaxID=1130410 RepID=A0ABR1XQF1_9PEZI